jgi:uncharacterized membrane protein
MVQINPTMPQTMQGPGSAGERTEDINVGETERLLSVIGGGIVALGGLAFCPNTIGKLVSAGLGGALIYRGLSGHCHIYSALGMDTAEKYGQQSAVEAGAGNKVEHAVTIDRPRNEVYRFWRQLHNLPRFMRHLKEVQILDPKRSHWIARGPLGMSIEWDAEIINERPGEMIAWRSLPGSEMDTAGSVHFEEAPGGRGTTVRVSLKYDPPAGKAGAAIARLLGDAPEQQIREDLARFKQLMEAGQLAASSGAGRMHSPMGAVLFLNSDSRVHNTRRLQRSFTHGQDAGDTA